MSVRILYNFYLHEIYNTNLYYIMKSFKNKHDRIVIIINILFNLR